MNAPKQADEAFLTDVQTACADDSIFHLWWLGQSGFLLKWNRRCLLFDPYLSDSLTRKYADTDKPHVRMTGRVIAPERLDFIDVVTSSHNHTDHLDAETLNPLRRVNPHIKIVAPEANRTFVAERLGCDADGLIGMKDGSRVEMDGFTIEALPSAHEELETNERGEHRCLGYVVRFGSWTVYHSGDTVRYEGMAERLKAYRIDVGLLPINGRSAERRVPGNLWGEEAAQLAREAAMRLVIPCHYDMFAFNTVTPEAFIQECLRLEQPFRILENGERWSSDE